MSRDSGSGPAPAPDPTPGALWAVPALFVGLWSTGFVVARLAMPHAPPLTFLCWRYVLSVVCLGAWSWATRAQWPRDARTWLHLGITGVMLQAGYLGGVWAAVKLGLSAGLTALIVALQPVLTAIFLEWRGGAGRVQPLQWLGLALGLAGVLLVVSGKLTVGEATPLNLALAVLALLSITAGTLYQKFRVSHADVRTGGAVQMGAALLVTWPLSWLEAEGMGWNLELVVALGWSVLVLTIGASSLLYGLIQRGAAMKVAGLFYLVPPCTAVMAWLLFDEPLTVAMGVGLVVTAAGVALVQRKGSRA